MGSAGQVVPSESVDFVAGDDVVKERDPLVAGARGTGTSDGDNDDGGSANWATGSLGNSQGIVGVLLVGHATILEYEGF